MPGSPHISTKWANPIAEISSDPLAQLRDGVDFEEEKSESDGAAMDSGAAVFAKREELLLASESLSADIIKALQEKSGGHQDASKIIGQLFAKPVDASKFQQVVADLVPKDRVLDHATCNALFGEILQRSRLEADDLVDADEFQRWYESSMGKTADPVVLHQIHLTETAHVLNPNSSFRSYWDLAQAVLLIFVQFPCRIVFASTILLDYGRLLFMLICWWTSTSL